MYHIHLSHLAKIQQSGFIQSNYANCQIRWWSSTTFVQLGSYRSCNHWMQMLIVAELALSVKLIDAFGRIWMHVIQVFIKKISKYLHARHWHFRWRMWSNNARSAVQCQAALQLVIHIYDGKFFMDLGDAILNMVSTFWWLKATLRAGEIDMILLFQVCLRPKQLQHLQAREESLRQGTMLTCSAVLVLGRGNLNFRFIFGQDTACEG